MSETFPSGEGEYSEFDDDELAYVDAEITEQWDRDSEFGELAEAIQTFDMTRHGLYDLVSNVMSGDVRIDDESDDPLQLGITVCCGAYRSVIEKVMEQYDDSSERLRVIGSLFMGDEQERIGLFRGLAPQGGFLETTEASLEQVHDRILQVADTEDEMTDLLWNIYSTNICADMNVLSDHFPSKVPVEESETRRERHRRLALGIAGDIGKMAAAATLAILITRKQNR